MTNESPLPLAGVRVVEVALGTSLVGAGLSSCVPGALLRDLGATVTRVESAEPVELDAGADVTRGWNHDKRIVTVDDGDPAAVRQTVTGLAAAADVLFLIGPEPLVDGAGLTYHQLAAAHPELVVVRVRPGRDAAGELPGYEILLHARVGLMGQIRGNRPGPIFSDFAPGSAGAALGAAVGALACLIERQATGRGGWAETSTYDGLLGILPMIIGRVEHPSPTTRLLWEGQGPQAQTAFECADGKWIQLWFGAKGAYEGFLAHIGDEPTVKGYNTENMDGTMVDRAKRWADTFITKDRAFWLEDLAGNDFRCEPILRPGEALLDEHVRHVGLALDLDDPELGTITVLGPTGRVASASSGDAPALQPRRLLEGVKVVDLSAYLAGPVAPQILAELGADVVKVEPAAGDAHRTMDPLFSAGQRGKRMIAVDLKAPGSKEILERLFRWGDIVHQNSRIGLDAKLGYDEASVRANPDVVYSHASGFGATGPRALLPTNDFISQALSGMEAGIGGPGNPPVFNTWGTIDVTGGWVSAVTMLAALFAQRRDGGGKTVATTLLGAGMLTTSRAYVAQGEVHEGPIVDAAQTGYGPTYRIYECADGDWFALVVPDQASWDRLRSIVDGLPAELHRVRTVGGGDSPAEPLLEQAFADRERDAWLTELRAAGLLVEPVLDADRGGFIDRLVDDPVNRQLGRVASFDWGAKGRFEQPAFTLRMGPEPRRRPPLAIAELGEHTDAVLDTLGFTADERAALAADGTVTIR